MKKNKVLIVNKSENIGAVFFTIAVLSLAGVAGYEYQKKKEAKLMLLTIK